MLVTDGVLTYEVARLLGSTPSIDVTVGGRVAVHVVAGTKEHVPGRQFLAAFVEPPAGPARGENRWTSLVGRVSEALAGGGTLPTAVYYTYPTPAAGTGRGEWDRGVAAWILGLSLPPGATRGGGAPAPANAPAEDDFDTVDDFGGATGDGLGWGAEEAGAVAEGAEAEFVARIKHYIDALLEKEGGSAFGLLSTRPDVGAAMNTIDPVRCQTTRDCTAAMSSYTIPAGLLARE